MKYIYVMRCGVNHYKIGIAIDATKRLSGIQTGNPEKVDLICTRLVDKAEQHEADIHEYRICESIANYT